MIQEYYNNRLDDFIFLHRKNKLYMLEVVHMM